MSIESKASQVIHYSLMCTSFCELRLYPQVEQADREGLIKQVIVIAMKARDPLPQLEADREARVETLC